ncbi:MAG: 50S ribosomal protein L9 [Prevotellaceae bacterium]|jgi:large subunit ribosomal protein L9|nr:50S ribosomal protein L9 [Prevotellaceae bacterium]
MEIILKEDVVNLGYKDDIVKVKDGYGRNYLIPTKKAVIASESAKKMLAEDLRQRAHKIEQIRNEAIALADKLKDVVLTVSAKTSATGKIFGAVNAIHLADAFEKAGYVIDKRVISLKEPVKEIGSYKATLKLHREVSVEIPFEVIAED